jgi:hypothetical protein
MVSNIYLEEIGWPCVEYELILALSFSKMGNNKEVLSFVLGKGEAKEGKECLK